MDRWCNSFSRYACKRGRNWMNDLYDVWFTREELIKLDEALHILENKDPNHFDYESLMIKLDHLIERSNETKV